MFNSVVPKEEIHQKDFSLFLSSSGELFGKGSNKFGQISDSKSEFFPENELIAKNVISAAAGTEYTVYITENGYVHIQGNGRLRKLFSGLYSAEKVFATENNQFVVITHSNIFVFGNNENEEIEERKRTLVFSKERIPFSACWDPYFAHPSRIEKVDEYGNKNCHYWNEEDSAQYWKDHYFDLSGFYCSSEIYLKRKQLFLKFGESNIEWEIDFDVDFNTYSYRNGDYYRQDFNGFSAVRFFRLNQLVFTPLELKATKFFELFAFYYRKTCPQLPSERAFSKIRLFSSDNHMLILHDGNLYGIGCNYRGEISDDDVEVYKEPHLMATNVISADTTDGYSIYVTSDGEVKLVGRGELSDNFRGFKGAKRVYAAKYSLFYIVDNNGLIYGFGDNSSEKIQKHFSSTVLETKIDKLTKENFIYLFDCVVAHPTYHHSSVNYVNHTLCQKPEWKTLAREIFDHEFQHSLGYFHKKHGSRNISLFYEIFNEKIIFSDPALHEMKITKENYPFKLTGLAEHYRNLARSDIHNEKYADFSAETFFRIQLTNNIIYTPVLLHGDFLENARGEIAKRYFSFSSELKINKNNVKKLIVHKQIYNNIYCLALLKNGKLLYFDSQNTQWRYAKTPFEKIDDIALLTDYYAFFSPRFYEDAFAISSYNEIYFLEYSHLTNFNKARIVATNGFKDISSLVRQQKGSHKKLPVKFFLEQSDKYD